MDDNAQSKTFKHTVKTNQFSVSYTVSSECLLIEVLTSTGQRLEGRVATHNWNTQALQNSLSAGPPIVSETSQGISVTPPGWVLPPVVTVPVSQSEFDLEHTFALLEKDIKEVIPKGVIVMWFGTSVPIGWHLCDGTNGTPDLRDKFIVGAGKSYKLADTGGSKEVALRYSQSHSKHTLTKKEEEEEEEDDEIGGDDFADGIPEQENHEKSLLFNYLASGNTHPSIDRLDHLHQTEILTANSQAEILPHENRPPFYAVYYIIKI